jgi:hypothetical protein
LKLWRKKARNRKKIGEIWLAYDFYLRGLGSKVVRQFFKASMAKGCGFG